MSFWRFIPSAVVLTLLCIYPSFARVQKTEKIIQVTPQFLMAEIIQQVPADKCSQSEGYFRTCFEMSEKECQENLKSVFKKVGNEFFAKKWHQKFELTLQGNAYALEIGTRAGFAFESQFKSKKRALDDCYRMGAFPE